VTSIHLGDGYPQTLHMTYIEQNPASMLVFQHVEDTRHDSKLSNAADCIYFPPFNDDTTHTIDCITRKWQQVFARWRCNIVCDWIICWDTCTLGSIRIAVGVRSSALGAGGKSLAVDSGIYVHAFRNICMASRN